MTTDPRTWLESRARRGSPEARQLLDLLDALAPVSLVVAWVDTPLAAGRSVPPDDWPLAFGCPNPPGSPKPACTLGDLRRVAALVRPGAGGAS